MMIDRDAFRV